MNRLTRITAILIHLQSKKLVTAKDIAKRFHVSLRTVYRDIKTLQDAGVPIGSENGIGYFIVEGYSLPPIMITEEEANALVVAEKLIMNQGDLSLKKDFDSLLYKIKSVLRSFQKENVALLEDRISPSSLKGGAVSNSLSNLQRAITKNQVARIVYRSIYKGEITEREIEPLGLYFSTTAWILISHCRSRNDYREFRLDRIIDYKITRETFESRTEFMLNKYFSEKYDYS